MSRRLVSPSIDGPSPLMSRVAAHVALAESRDRVFVTLPVAVARELLTLAELPLPLPEAMRVELERDASRLPHEAREAYIAARLEQVAAGAAARADVLGAVL